VNWSPLEVALVPAGVVTVTSTVPLPGGEVAVHELANEQDTPLAATEPNLTAESTVKPVPMIATLVPPAGGPTLG